MLIGRPIRTEDLSQLEALTRDLPDGNAGSFHTNREGLESVIQHSMSSFERPVTSPGDEEYVFVLEDLQRKSLIGLFKLSALVNRGFPFYTYEIRSLPCQSSPLEVHKNVQALFLVDDYSMASLPSSLFIASRYRAKGYTLLLVETLWSYAREFPLRFSKKAIDEYRGHYDDQGRAIFWKYIVEPFIGSIDYQNYLKLLRKGLESEVIRLLPKGPIYLPLLPKAATAIIGKAHPDSRPISRLVESRGFRFCQHISYLSGAPIVEAPFHHVFDIPGHQQIIVEKIIPSISTFETFLINNLQSDLSFKVIPGKLQFSRDGGAIISSKLAQSLSVVRGDNLGIFPIKLRRSIIEKYL